MDSLRLTTLIEQKQSRTRRHTTAGLGNLFKTAIGGAFVSFLEQAIARRPTIQQNEESISETFRQINEIIQTVDQHIGKRMQSHEQQLFGIVREQVQTMREEMSRVVDELNERISQKNVDSEVWRLSNELDYFRSQAFKLFQENKRFRMEIKIMRKKMVDCQTQQECLEGLLRKLRKKEMKWKSKGKERVRLNLSQEELTEKRKINKEKQLQESIKIKVHKERYPEKEEQDSMIQINFDTIKQEQQIKANQFQFITKPDQKQQEKDSESISIVSLGIPSEQPSNPSVHLQRADSYEMSSFPNPSMPPLRQKQDKCTQTDPVEIMPQSIKQLIEHHNQKTSSHLTVNRTNRCKTEKNMDNSGRRSDAYVSNVGKRVTKVGDWLGQKYTFRVVNQKRKESKNVMYMSSVIGKNKLKVSPMVETSQQFRTNYQ